MLFRSLYKSLISKYKGTLDSPKTLAIGYSEEKMEDYRIATDDFRYYVLERSLRGYHGRLFVEDAEDEEGNSVTVGGFRKACRVDYNGTYFSQKTKVSPYTLINEFLKNKNDIFRAIYRTEFNSELSHKYYKYLKPKQ